MLYRVLLALSLIIPVSIILTTSPETMTPGFFADEAVYFSMTQSLALDGDLIWTRDDLARICETHPAGPVGIILKKLSNQKIVYAKPLTYPLVAAPFYLICGTRGIALLNIITAWIVLSWLSGYWGSTLKSTLASILFLLFSAWSPYTLWYHPEIFTSFLLAGFLMSWMTEKDKPTSGWMMAVCLALASTIKPPLIILGIPALVEMIKSRRWKPIVIFIATVTIILCLTILLTGNLNPYEGNRRIFNTQFPLDSTIDIFGQGDGWSMENARFVFDWNVFVWNVFFFWFGRFTGIAWYFFPGLVTTFLAVIARSNSRGKWILAVSGMLILIQLVFIPSNYHGGGGALGNRYFVNLYPLLLFALPRLPKLRTVLLTGVVAGCLCGPFLIHPWFSSREPGEFARHGLYTYLPVEWTLVGAYPIFHPTLYGVTLTGIDGKLYFIDRQSSGLMDNGFYVFSGKASHIVVELNSPENTLNLQLHSDRSGARGVISSPGYTTPFHLGPDEIQPLIVRLGNGHQKRDIYGIERWIHSITIRFNPSLPAENRNDYGRSRVFIRASLPVLDNSQNR